MLKLTTSGDKKHIEEVRRQVITWEKIPAIHTSYSGLVSRLQNFDKQNKTKQKRHKASNETQ